MVKIEKLEVKETIAEDGTKSILVNMRALSSKINEMIEVINKLIRDTR
jgi:hypothetical protein